MRMLSRIKKYLVITIIIFCCSTIIGITYASTSSPDSNFIEFIDNQIFGSLINQPEHILALFIFVNNASTCFLSIFFGLFFGIFPLIVLALNGFLMGYLAYYAFLDHGIIYPIVALAPHGVIELTAVFICCALGLKLGVSVSKRIINRYPQSISSEFMNSLKLFLYLAVPLLLVAAFIEIYITPVLVKMVI